MSKYWLFSKASRSFRASTLPDRSTTAVGTCLTSVLIAQPKMKSMATGTNSMSVSASRSRQSWRNSFAMMPWSRLPTSTPPGGDEPALVDEAGGVAQLRLVHVVGGHEDCRPRVGEPPDARPERAP